MGILQSPPSIRHTFSSLTIGRNPTKFGVWVAHMNGACKGTIFCSPHPLGPWGGAKSQISFNIITFQLQSQFQRFLNQTLCVFSQTYQMGFFIRPPWSCTKGGTWGYRWGCGVNFFFFLNSTRFGVLVTYMNGTCTGTIFWVPAPWGLGEGPNGQISLNLNYKVNFKDF